MSEPALQCAASLSSPPAPARAQPQQLNLEPYLQKAGHVPEKSGTWSLAELCEQAQHLPPYLHEPFQTALRAAQQSGSEAFCALTPEGEDVNWHLNFMRPKHECNCHANLSMGYTPTPGGKNFATITPARLASAAIPAIAGASSLTEVSGTTRHMD